jgi:uncharacterized YigZ family protein
MEDAFKTIEKPSEGYFKDKGSKFIAYAFPVKNEEEIKELLAKIKKEHHSARHHCYAWRLGEEEILSRSNDDGEPSSTAGKPILGQLQSYGVTNTLLVVVRYFGGILLGTSGLINAYRTAAGDALNNATIKTGWIERFFELQFTYEKMNEVMLIIKQENLNVVTTRFEESCQLVFSVKKSEAQQVETIFMNLYGVDIKKTENC